MKKYDFLCDKNVEGDVETTRLGILDSFVGRDANIISSSKGMDHSFVKRNTLIKSDDSGMNCSYIGGSAEIQSKRDGLEESSIQKDAKIQAGSVGLKGSFIGGKIVIYSKSHGLVRSFVRNYVGRLECEGEALCGSPFNLVVGKIKGNDLNNEWCSMLATNLIISHDIQIKYLFNVKPNCNVIVPKSLPRKQICEQFIHYDGSFIDLINYARAHPRELTGLRCLKVKGVKRIASLEELLELNSSLEQRLESSNIDYLSLLMYETHSCDGDYCKILSDFFKIEEYISNEDELIRVVRENKILEEFASGLPFIKELRKIFLKKYIQMKKKGSDDKEIREKLSLFCGALKKEQLQKWLPKSEKYIGPIL